MDNIETMGYDLYGYGFVASQGEGTGTGTNNVKHKTVSVPSGFSQEEVTIEMENIQNEYKIAWISDLHMMDRNDVDVNAKLFGGSQENVDLRYNTFQNSINFFDNIIDCLIKNYKSGDMDAVVFGGDIMDNYGDNTYSVLESGLNKLRNANVPFMFLTADHDYLTELTKSSGEKTDANSLDGSNGNIKTLTLGDNEESITLIGQAFSNKSSNFNTSALSSALSNSSENALYFTHVPIESKTQATKMQSWCQSTDHKKVYYWSSNSESGYNINDISSYVNTLYNSSKIKGVFAGHVHTSSKSQNFQFTDNAIEHVFSASYNKNIGIITVTPSSDSEGEYYNEDGLIEELEEKNAYRYLTAYLISDNYAYYIKNHNFNFRTMFLSSKQFFGGLNFFNSGTSWGSGLISIYEQADGSKKVTGKRGKVYGSLGDKLLSNMVFLPTAAATVSAGVGGVPAAILGAFKTGISIFTDWDQITSEIKVNRANRNLMISASGLFSNQVFNYSLDGWTGRYSMPLEFLLSTHIATMAPDLSFKLATTFNTDVEILLWKSTDNKMVGAIQTEDGTIIEVGDFKQDFGLADWVNGRTDAVEIFKNNPVLHSRTDGEFACEGTGSVEAIGDFDYEISSDSFKISTITDDELLMIIEDFKERYAQNIKVTDFPIDEFLSEFKKLYEKVTFDDAIEYDQVKDDLTDEFGNDLTGQIGYDLATEMAFGKFKNSKRYIYNTLIEMKMTDQIYYDVITRLRIYQDHISVYYTIRKVTLNGNANQIDENECCCEKARRGEIKKTCESCYKYIKTLYDATQALSDKNFDMFVPYINCVTDHWFRDVYFTKGAMEQNNVTDVIAVDEDYYLSTGEMWTQYDRNADGSDYELYVYLPDSSGNYSSEFAENGTLVCREGGPYSISEEAGNLYDKKGNGGYGLYLVNGSGTNKTYTEYGQDVEKFKVGKKAITEQKEDDWNAYDLEVSKPEEMAEWEIYEGNGDDENKAIAKVKEMEGVDLVYKLTTVKGTITQKEDGVRGQTNAKTKKLFLDDYYLYDGSGPRAALIEEAKIKADSDDPDSFRQKFGATEIKATYKDKPYTATIDDISGPINILQNSLTAFSILRNMHTLDAEYIYHDFKELIVELDYFDKEDLIESEREVMMFPISGLSSAGWPVTRYDKSEEFYGTLLHSAKDYETKKQETIEELAALFGEEVEEEEAEQSPAEPNPDAVTSDNLLVKAAADIMSYMQDNEYAYCQGGTYHSNPSTAHPGRSCYRAPSFEDSQQPTHNLIDCSGFVSWCLQEVGILPKGTLLSSSTISSATVLSPYYTAGGKSSYLDYNPGTIIIYSGHVNIYAGNGVFYDAGSTNSMMKSPRDVSGWNPASSVVGYIEIPNNKMTYEGVTGIGGTITMPEFNGYEGGEPVLAPVTGEVIKYGTVKRKNLETEQDEEVGFIKIRVLGNQEALPGSTCNYFGKDDKKKGYNYFWEEYTEASITNHVLYIEGFDVSQVLGGNGDTNCGVKGPNIAKLKEYIEQNDDDGGECNYTTEYKVPDSAEEGLSQKEKDKRKEKHDKEEAKKGAAYVIEEKNRIYIKEGAVIGHTYTEDQADMKDGVGNYMRLIFRDADDQVVENVEHYMEIEEPALGAVSSESQDYVAEPGDLELLANLLHHEGCEGFFTRNVFSGDSKLGAVASRVTGYVLINRARSNYGGHGTTIRDQICAPGQYSTAYDVLHGEATYCNLCLANAEWCLKFDCSSVMNPSGESMPSDVYGQSGWCQCKSGKFNCWWWIDTNKDGKRTEYTDRNHAFDTFYCK